MYFLPLNAKTWLRAWFAHRFSRIWTWNFVNRAN